MALNQMIQIERENYDFRGTHSSAEIQKQKYDSLLDLLHEKTNEIFSSARVYCFDCKTDLD